MNILNTLTLRHLRLNKKRTVVTIIGVILSAAMMIAVTSLVVSIQDLLMRDAVHRIGDWHGIYYNVSQTQAENIAKDKNVKKAMYGRPMGYAKYEAIKNIDKPYILVKEYDRYSLENIARLMEGRLPQNDNEILIPEHLMSNGKVKLKVGDAITLNIGERVNSQGKRLGQNNSYSNENNEDGEKDEKIRETIEKTYTIVGVTERPDLLIEPYSAPGYTAVTFAEAADIKGAESMDIAVQLKRISASANEKLGMIAEQNGVENFAINRDLLMALGSFKDDGLNQVLYGSAAVVIILIIIGSVALIYNAFSISVTDRLRQFGMLSSVGATKKQIRKAVRTEAACVTVIGLPIGILCGLAGIGITMVCMNPVIQSLFDQGQPLKLVVSLESVVIAAALVAVTVWISSAIPSRRAVSISPVEAIRQSPDIKMDKRGIKTSFLTRILFGIEGDIALKNLKRNRKRYRATVFSLIISIVLFISVSSFTLYVKKASSIGMDEFNYDLKVTMSPVASVEEGEEHRTYIYHFFDEISKLDGIDNYSVITKEYLTAEVEKELMNSKLAAWFPFHYEGNKAVIQIGLLMLDDVSFKKYVEQIGVKEELFRDTENPAGILINRVNVREDGGKYVETEHFDWEKVRQDKKYSEVTLKTYGTEAKSSILLGAATDKVPIGVNFSRNAGSAWVVVSREVGEKVSHIFNTTAYVDMYLDTDKATELEPQISDLYNISPAGSRLGGDMTMRNANEANKTEGQILLLISVFVYGFIILITLIGVANIFNTISTNIALRRREFAMLKSVGMTPASFAKMMNSESILYGMKALLYGLPIGIGVSFLFYRIFMNGLDFKFMLPWFNIGLCIVCVMAIVFTTMLYSSSKIRNENIIDALRQENI